MAQYDYVISMDFPFGVVNSGDLADEINASAITSTSLSYVSSDLNIDTCRIVFAGTLLPAEITILDGIVAAHAGTPSVFDTTISQEAADALTGVDGGKFVKVSVTDTAGKGYLENKLISPNPELTLFIDESPTDYERLNVVANVGTAAGTLAAGDDSRFDGAGRTVAITVNDTTPQHLDDKLLVSSGLQKTTNNPGFNESITLSPIYGTAVSTICEGNDARLSDARQAKVSSNDTTQGWLFDKIVGDGAYIATAQLNDGADEDLRILANTGVAAGTLAVGDDSRFPTQDENNALQGTNGTPSDINRYVTDSDPRNTNARTPTGAAGPTYLGGTYPNPDVRAIRHIAGTTLTIGTIKDGEVLSRSGTFINSIDPTTISQSLPITEHFISSQTVTNTIGSQGWGLTKSGSGSAFTITHEAGHPGIASLNPGTNSSGFCALHLGGAGNPFTMSISGTNAMTIEFLIKFTTSISPADLEFVQLGFGQEVDIQGVMNNGLFMRFAPSTSPNFLLVAANAGASTVSISTVPVVISKWYRVGILIDTPSAGASAQLYVNGMATGSVISTNIPPPTAGLAPFVKIDSSGGSGCVVLCDYWTFKQLTNQEDP